MMSIYEDMKSRNFDVLPSSTTLSVVFLYLTAVRYLDYFIVNSKVTKSMCIQLHTMLKQLSYFFEFEVFTCACRRYGGRAMFSHLITTIVAISVSITKPII